MPEQAPAKRPRHKIAIIGPVLPFRGGIAQNTTMLHRAMPEVVEHLTVSFTRQYPKLIFPGETDRDPAYGGYEEPGVEYLIDSLNPFTWGKAVRRIRSFGADTVVLPWWTVHWAFCFAYLAGRLRRTGISVVFFCYNVVEHESAAWKVWLTKWLLGRGSRYVVAHTREDEANLCRLFAAATTIMSTHIRVRMRRVLRYVTRHLNLVKRPLTSACGAAAGIAMAGFWVVTSGVVLWRRGQNAYRALRQGSREIPKPHQTANHLLT